MMDALDAGAEDFDAGEEAAEITTDPENYSAVVKAMEEKGYEILSDDLAMVPMTSYPGLCYFQLAPGLTSLHVLLQ